MVTLIRVGEFDFSHHTSIFQYLAMESTSENSTSNMVSTARTPFRRGISLKACVAKAAGWTLEANKDKIAPDHKEVKMT